MIALLSNESTSWFQWVNLVRNLSLYAVRARLCFVASKTIGDGFKSQAVKDGDQIRITKGQFEIVTA